MNSIFLQYGVLSSNVVSTTATPTINSLSCFEDGATSIVRVPVKNEDGSNASVEVSLSSDFSGSQTLTVNAGATTNFDFSGITLPPGSITAYARATVTNETISATQSRTQTLSICAL